ncbi:hypothetical protein XIS1_1240004 [Xenorhabdus innexi]|uniref:Uncharacterized protein n=1 Tax=Xenorhabdus innexi TaxID=290109 RepID=A0A1N6MSF2_9GAMM|nr:hypothetical protein XIS1_1240004 [Xenorhabdus innexi]
MRGRTWTKEGLDIKDSQISQRPPPKKMERGFFLVLINKQIQNNITRNH